MKGVEPAGTQHVEDGVFDASDVLNSTEAGGDDHELSGYVQDNFEFLDQMDCSAMDHMECSISYQVCIVLSVQMRTERGFEHACFAENNFAHIFK